MKCPACGFNNKRSALVCKGCNESLPEQVTSTGYAPNRACKFHDGPRYCPADGAYTNGDGWWCYWHRPTNSFQTNRLILDDLLDNGVRRIKDWRDQVMDLVMTGVSPNDALTKITGRIFK